MAVALAPGEVVLQVFQGRVEDDARIEGGDFLQFEIGEVGRPIEDIGGGKEAQDTGEDFVFSTIEDLCGFLEDEGEFIRIAISDDDLIETFHYFFCTFGHELDATHIVGFFETVNITEGSEATSVNSYNYKGIWKQGIRTLEFFNVLKFTICHFIILFG